MKIGIVGAGVVGGALAHWIDLRTINDVSIYDPGRDLNDLFEGVSAIFICVPAPTIDGRGQDLTAIISSIERFGKRHHVPFFIRTTVLPGTCDGLAEKFGVPVWAMPEFLTERRAELDMEELSIITGEPQGDPVASLAHRELVRRIFPGKHLTFADNREAELAKYAHNGFAAVKVNYFNLVERACRIMGLNYGTVLDGLFLSGHIEAEHTVVPGPDGQRGYGGKCLPKDLAALIGLFDRVGVSTMSLKAGEIENDQHRGSRV